jgi:hypothetical protein
MHENMQNGYWGKNESINCVTKMSDIKFLVCKNSTKMLIDLGVELKTSSIKDKCFSTNLVSKMCKTNY